MAWLGSLHSRPAKPKARRAAPCSLLTRCLPENSLLACCSGHQSFSNNKALNDFVGNIVHSSIMVP